MLTFYKVTGTYSITDFLLSVLHFMRPVLKLMFDLLHFIHFFLFEVFLDHALKPTSAYENI